MTDDPLPTLPEVLELATGAALTSAGLVLVNHLAPGSKEEAAAFIAIYGPLANTILGRGVRSTFVQRFAPFMRRFTRYYAEDPAEAHAKFEEAAKANQDNP